MHARAIEPRSTGEGVFDVIFRRAPVGLVITHLETGRYVDVNDAFLAAVGTTREQLVGSDSATLGIYRNAADRDALVAELTERGRVLDRRIEGRTLTGGTVHCRVWVELLEIDGDMCALSTVLDVTREVEAVNERKRLEDQLHHAQRMEAIGRLAGGIAHDFNNMISVIGGFASMVQGDLPDDSPLREDLEEIVRASARATGLTQQLLAFSRRQMLEPRPVNLGELVEDVGRMLARTLGDDIVVEVDAEPGTPTVMVDPTKLEQVLVNLAVNARDAMPGGGRLAIHTGSATVTDQLPSPGSELEPGRYALLRVTDSGTGMSPDVAAHVFEPFYTTKPKGQGTGLGLSTVHGVVRQSGGEITLQTCPGSGSCFAIYLPATDRFPVPLRRERPLRSSLRGRETVLVVEDEPMVRNLARQLLERAGYRVLCAGGPGEALLLAEDTSSGIDLLLTDVVMPLMSGPQLASRLSERVAGLRTVFMSGWADTDMPVKGPLAEAPRLPKPFDKHQLLEAVRRALEEPG